MPPFLSGFSISFLAHLILITGGVWWVGSASHSGGPAEFELVGVEAAYQSGRNVAAHKPSGAVKTVDRSELDEAVMPKKAAVAKAAAADSRPETKASTGMGGTAEANIGTTSDLWQRYGASVRQSILDGFRYPTASRNLGETGRVKIAFAILPDGSVTEVRLKHPSAYERLNDAAVAMVARIGRVEPLPQEGISRWDTEIAIDFTLN